MIMGDRRKTRGPEKGSQRMLTTAELAAEIGITSTTAYRWRRAGRGPRFIRTQSGRVRYPRAYIEQWLDEQTRTCTAVDQREAS